jgi:hypothetical protein
MSGSLDIKPAFQAEKVSGKFYRMVMTIEEDVRLVGNGSVEKKVITRKLVPLRQEFDEGWMIYFPQGHSMFVAADDVDQLRRIGVLEQPALIDMNSGDVVPASLSLSPKEIVARKSNNGRHRSTGGLTEVLQGDED